MRKRFHIGTLLPPQLLRITATLLCAVVSALGTLPALASEGDWQLQMEEDEIRVFTREVADSPFHAVKAVTRLKVSSDRVAELMGDGSSCAEWRAMCKSSKVIEVVSESERYIHMVLDLPWPISDRDLVIRSTTAIDDATREAVIDLQSESSRHPPQDYVRAETQGQMIISMLGPQEAEFTYIMHTDLGGDLPAGTVNSRLVDSAHEDLSRLRKMAEHQGS